MDLITPGVTAELVLRVLTGALCATLIGLERQLRARTAGLRTNALVGVGAALFVVLGASGFGGGATDPTRIAAQVVSGIGFLGAGVIMKQGGSVSGLNTAATLWASAAVGSLAGGGLYGLAIAGTGVVMLANTALRPLGRALDRRMGRGGEEEALDYSLEVRCQAAAAVDLRPLLVRSLHGPGSRVLSLETRDTQPDGAAIVAHVRCGRDAEDRLESAMGAVSRLPAVTAVLWRALDVESPD